MKKKVLFIDRDGTLIHEPPITFQVDRLDQLHFLPGVIVSLHKIATELDFELVMVTNQDGLGTAAYPEENFQRTNQKMCDILAGEGIHFAAIHVDRSFPAEGLATRKPGIGMLGRYFGEAYDLENSFVIGDRVTDLILAQNLGCKAIFIPNNEAPTGREHLVALTAKHWSEIYTFLKLPQRIVAHSRKTQETQIRIGLNLDGSGQSQISTGLGFFDHMLDQLARHGNLDLNIQVKGDLHIDEHHSIEDTAIALGEAFALALHDKRGIERYGFCLPMDDCLAQVALDFGGRNWLEWKASFKREKIGEMPTEMFFHFFKSFSDGAKCNLNIIAEGENEHHKIEAIFKAWAKAIKMAVRRDANSRALPSTKGVL